MSKDAEEIRLCRLFLLDPNHHPDNPSKPMKAGFGPYKGWMEKCDKHKDVLNDRQARSPGRSLARSPERSSARSPERLLVRSPERSSARSPERLLVRSPEKSLARSPERSLVRSPGRSLIKAPERSVARSPERSRAPIKADPYTRNRFVNTEEINRDVMTRDRLRPMKLKLPLLSLVQLTVDEFDAIKNLSYDKFIDEVIKRTNNNGGNITKHYMNDIIGKDIVVEVPKKYTSKQTGNNIVKFHDDKGITNGRLLYNLASYIRSNYPDYRYFTGLNQEYGNQYKLMINYEGW